MRDACNYVGRGCSDFGGACANLGTDRNPLYECVGTCHSDRPIYAPDYECRISPGEEQTCIPVDDSFWYTPPADGSDGYCWPASFP